jgi:hypothetical protein
MSKEKKSPFARHSQSPELGVLNSSVMMDSNSLERLAQSFNKQDEPKSNDQILIDK